MVSYSFLRHTLLPFLTFFLFFYYPFLLSFLCTSFVTLPILNSSVLSSPLLSPFFPLPVSPFPPFPSYPLLFLEVQKLYGHNNGVVCVAISNCGQWLASACKARDRETAAVLIWNLNKCVIKMTKFLLYLIFYYFFY